MLKDIAFRAGASGRLGSFPRMVKSDAVSPLLRRFFGAVLNWAAPLVARLGVIPREHGFFLSRLEAVYMATAWSRAVVVNLSHNGTPF